ncbi:FAD binding domain-containing protein [Tribonema minus]|uniref:L-aspartate oxidase n=1 Tax=Tribonema minus TaxID=303371 RepID=A0A835ZBM2_9STRA|nr:FAD binding domain-containing protein [Tribonema minus]
MTECAIPARASASARSSLSCTLAEKASELKARVNRATESRRFGTAPSLPISLHTDLLVLGCGIAGTSAALKAANQGLRVTMLSAASDVEDCNSFWAQGGIIYKSHDDQPRLLAKDVHSAGAGICDDAAVMKLATEGPARVEEILLGLAPVAFDRSADGALALCLEASHSRARIIHWRDETGKAITQAVQAAARAHPNITLVTGAAAVDLALAVDGGVGGRARCVGAHILVNGAPRTLLAPATVLATGGLGEIYAHTSNPASARGDGFAMAARAGAALSNMEYVQFHPTTLRLPGERSFLLTEALRGEGAVLRDARTRRAFARVYHPDGELAPRDVVSRMIVAEMRRSGADHVLLDITHRDAAWTARRFPGIQAHCVARGLDLTRDPLPVVPAAHYFCGGVATDLDGATSLPGLYAAGEVACTGLHGGNRLASTSLLEGLVWGCAIAEHLGAHSNSGGTRLAALACDAAAAMLVAPVAVGTARADGAAVAAAWERLKATMWENVGVVRTRDGLLRAVEDLAELRAFAARAYAGAAPSAEMAALRNAVDTAAVIAEAALSNRRSIGAHYLADEEEVEEALSA